MIKKLEELNREISSIDNGSLEIRLRPESSHYQEVMDFLSHKDLVVSMKKRVG